jgi:hypothetical protein
MAHTQHTHSLPHLEEALTVLFCLIDDAYRLPDPRAARRYESIKRLSDSEIITLALLRQLRGVESERSFLRDAQRFFAELFPGVHHARRAGNQDRGEDSSLHLRVLGQPASGSSSRAHQGAVGMKPRNTHLGSSQRRVNHTINRCVHIGVCVVWRGSPKYRW